MNWHHPEISDLIRRALAEDIGSGDITTEACIEPELTAQGHFLAREPMVVAGVELLSEIYRGEDIHLQSRSGDTVEAGAVLATVTGSAATLLTLERTALNFVQHLSGIATLTREFVEAIAGTGCHILDTRKTTPGLRQLEKLAVAAGGGRNHRMGLFDAILVQNNPITAAGGIREAYERAKAGGLPVEIEVRSAAELNEALAAGAHHLLLDNFSPEDAGQAIAHVAGRAKVEVSGGITLATARAYAESGADFLSVGMLTHSARATDISFRLI